MTFAFGHLIGAWIAGKSYEFFSKNKIGNYTWAWLILGGILPDADFLVDFVLRSNFHRTFTHSFLFVVLAWSLAFFVFWLFGERQAKKFAFALAMGVLVHLLIDFVSHQGVPFFWPLNYYFTPFGMTLGKSGVTMLSTSANQLRTFLKLAILDLGLGTVWIFYLWMKRRLKF